MTVGYRKFKDNMVFTWEVKNVVILFSVCVSLLSMYILVSLSDLTSNVILSFSAYRNLCPSIANLFVVLNKKNSSLTIYLVHLCI